VFAAERNRTCAIVCMMFGIAVAVITSRMEITTSSSISEKPSRAPRLRRARR